MRALLLIAVALIGCRSVDNIERKAPLGVTRNATDTAPRTLTLPAQRDSVLMVTFTVTSVGYSAALEKKLGAPSQSVDLDRDVLITAKDGAGNTIAATSVFNPRLIRTVGTREPKQAILSTGAVTIAFRRPQAIASISVEVRRGPNAGYKADIQVPGGTVRVREPGRDSL